MPVNPGGFAVYRNGRVVGAVGVSGRRSRSSRVRGVCRPRRRTRVSAPLPIDPLPVPGAVFIDGLRLPFFADCISVACVEESIRARAAARERRHVFRRATSACSRAPAARSPTGYLIGRIGSAERRRPDAKRGRRIVDQAVARALVTRAQIRLPLTQPTRMVIAVSDQSGEILAALSHGRLDGLLVRRGAGESAQRLLLQQPRRVRSAARVRADAIPYDSYEWEPEPPAGQGWAITNRTLGYGGQPLFPPGIDLEKPPTPGPWFDLFLYDRANPCTKARDRTAAATASYLNQSGIVWFPGSAPLYKGGRLVGGVGVSGDGVDQDDYVTAGGA